MSEEQEPAYIRRRQERERKGLEARTQMLERRKYWVELITGLGIWATVIVTLLAVMDTHQSSEKQLGALQKQIGVARSSSRALLRQDQRPLLQPLPYTADKISLTSGQPIVMPITVKNIGKTPAQQIEILTTVEILKANEEPHILGNFAGEILRAGIIFPNGEQTIPVGWGTNDNGPKVVLLTPQQLKDVAAGQIYFALYIHINYVDVFGVKHWSKFCQEFSPVLPIPHRECAFANSVDTNIETDEERLADRVTADPQ
jgi:hypothetical protein